MKFSIKRLISISFLLLFFFETTPCKLLKNTLITLAESDAIIIIAEDDEKALYEAVKILNKSGGTIYIDTPVINISNKSTLGLTGTNEGGIVGKKQSDGTYPRLDFKKSRNSGSTSRGITISGSNLFIKYLIIENAGDNGIWIGGNKNTIDHVITRYNNDTGIQLSNGATGNTLNYCYSYRNCDVPTFGGNADGFAPKLGTGDTTFNYCFAWENSDDGWDSFDKEGDNSSVVTYLHSACWNNGNPDIFTGKFDFDNGKTLDKNMWTVQQLMESDSDFESNYKNKKFNIDKGKINGISAKEWLSQASGAMNGNGLKFGSKYTPQGPNIKRTAEWCVVFDHKNKGFDNNGSQKCTGYFTNCVSFNNNINYQLPYTFSKWENNWSWGAKSKDQNSMNQTLKKPSNENSATKNFYSVRDQIIKAVYANTFPIVTFDDAIKKLN